MPPIPPFHLTDEQWQLVRPLILSPPPTAARGRPPLDDRLILEAILWKIANQAPWYNLPPDYPSHQTCYRRYRQWGNKGVLRKILSALYHDLENRCGLDLLAALRNGSIRVTRRGRYYQVKVTEDLVNDCCIPTALIYVSLAETIARRAEKNCRLKYYNIYNHPQSQL